MLLGGQKERGAKLSLYGMLCNFHVIDGIVVEYS